MDAQTELNEWFHECHREFFKFLVKLTGESNLAEDIIQETYAKAYLKFALFKPEKGTLKNWLYKIAINLYYDHERFSKKETAAAFEYYHYSRAENSDSRYYDNLKDTLSSAIKLLPHEKRLLLLLSFDNTYAQISQMIDIPEGTIKSRLFNIKKELKAIMEGLLKEE
ncbi:MAG: RNA polymerase sigma factor [Candidatus Wallbacteria bacterium]